MLCYAINLKNKTEEQDWFFIGDVTMFHLINFMCLPILFI